MNISDFYKRLRDLCEKRGMTINELVKSLELSSGSPTAWKNGVMPRQSTLTRIADYFGVTIDYLATGMPANIYECPNDENPWEEDLLSAFDRLDTNRQIQAVAHVQSMADDLGGENKKSPAEPKLSEGEEMLINLFRQVPADQQQLVLQMIRAALNSQK